MLKWNSRSTWFDEDYLINQKWFTHGSAHMQFAEMQSQSSCISGIVLLLHGEYLIISRIDSDKNSIRTTGSMLLIRYV